MIHGIFGRPFVGLERLLNLDALDDVHAEVCLALSQVPVAYTGGSHRSMGIMPASLEDTAHGDYVEALRTMSEDERRTFVSLADDPKGLAPADALDFGEEKEHELSRRQMLWLKHRFGVYFPWQVYFEMVPNKYWDEKSEAEGKDFTRLAKTFLPKTIAFVRSLPFRQIGRCNVMGLDPNQHGTVHRDGDPTLKRDVDHFITLCPAANKRLFLWDEEARAKTLVPGRAYWFNDSDYHGVEADPWFRYSIRIDGVFDEGFLQSIENETKGNDR